MIEVVYGIYVYAMTNVARGSVRVRHIRSWDRIALGDKVRVSISYYVIRESVRVRRTVVGPYRVRVRVRVRVSVRFSEYLIRRTALYYFNPVKNNTYITLIVMVSVIMFARWRLRMSSMLLLPIRM